MDATAHPASPAALSHAETRLIVWGMLLPVFMSSLDQTILASALPTIGRDLGDVHSLPWLVTAYLIASAAVTPLYGKVSDIHGRRLTVLIALATYMVGSIVCLAATNMPTLICGRVLHGLGGGGMASMGMVVLGDLAGPRERGKYYAWFSATYTTAGACGPALGGFIAQNLHWKVIFALGLAMGVAAWMLSWRLLRRLPRHERYHSLDVLGALLIMAASTAFMLALSLGGVRYPWSSPQILGLGAAALVLGGGFIARMRSAPEPLIPLPMLRDPVVRCTFLMNSFGWGSIVGLNIFLPIYLQSVIGMSPTNAGLSLMVLMVTVNGSAGVAGQVYGRMTHYKWLPMAGLALAITAVMTLALTADRLSALQFEVLLALIGIGFGPVPPACSIVLQNSVAIHQFGTAVGTMNFSRTLYTTILIAIFGAIVLTGVPAGAATALGAVAADGFRRVFFAAAASLTVAFLGLLLLEEKPLQSREAPAKSG
ncbi:MAG TPA: MFS transporter [Xanthobacteraceae bacterium]